MLPWADLSLHTLAQSVSAHFNTMLPWADQRRFCQAADCSAFDELHVSSTHCHVAGEQSSKKKIQTSDKTAGTLYSEAAQSNNQKYRLLTKQLVYCILKLHNWTWLGLWNTCVSTANPPHTSHNNCTISVPNPPVHTHTKSHSLYTTAT